MANDRHLLGVGNVAVIGGGALVALLLARRARASTSPASDPRNGHAPAVLGSLGAELAVQRVRDAAKNDTRRNARKQTARQLQRADDVDVDRFATTVHALADSIEGETDAGGRARGRFGGRKVFIAALRRALRGTDYKKLPRADVDELILRAHRAGLLQLARADLVAAMDPDEIRDSLIVHPSGAEFHFVLAPHTHTKALSHG